MICESAERATPDIITREVTAVRKSGMTFMGDMAFPLVEELGRLLQSLDR
jgi:hypothetical protein